MTLSTLRKRAMRKHSHLEYPDHHHGPRKRTVDAILAYSKALTVVDAPPIGQVEIILN